MAPKTARRRRRRKGGGGGGEEIIYHGLLKQMRSSGSSRFLKKNFFTYQYFIIHEYQSLSHSLLFAQTLPKQLKSPSDKEQQQKDSEGENRPLQNSSQESSSDAIKY